MIFSPLFLAVLGAIQVSAHQAPFTSDSATYNENKYDLDALRLVKVIGHDSGPAVWITERQKLEGKRSGLNYFDITEAPSFFDHALRAQRKHTYPPSSNKTTAYIKRLLPILSTDGPRHNLAKFTSFWTRFYQSETGRESSEWLLERIQNYTAELATDEQKEIIEAKAFSHPWKQTSVIVRFSPKNTSLSDPVTILGAHCDSQNYANHSDRAPGADDDGSGTVTILESFRGLLVAGYVPLTPLEFHFYAAEEAGLLGSIGVVDAYAKANRAIKGMLQFDMTAWRKNGTEESLSIITNEVDGGLTTFVGNLVTKYITIPARETHYPRGAGSDHMSWTRAGFQSAQVFEGAFSDSNRNIHGVHDRIDISAEFSFDHLLHFARLGAAYAVEMTS